MLLDPNYGMFVYDRRADAQSVIAALNYLFSETYPEPGLQVLNQMIRFGVRFLPPPRPFPRR